MKTIKMRIWELIDRLHTEYCQDIRAELRMSGYAHRRNEEMERQSISAMSATTIWTGRPVICISTDDSDPVIGVVKKIDTVTRAHDPVPLVVNYLKHNKEEVLVFGKVLPFTWQIFDAVFRLDVEQRVALLFSIYRTKKEVSFEEPRSEKLTQSEAVAMLASTGFFDATDESKELYEEAFTNKYALSEKD